MCHLRTPIITDDALLFCIINSPEDFVALQEDIDKIWSWSRANFLTLNMTKCKYMIVFGVDISKIINVDQEEEGTKDRSLWYSRNNRSRLREFTVNYNGLRVVS